MAISFLGLVKWSLDLCVYLLQEIFSLYYTIKHETHAGRPDRATNLPWIQAEIQKHHSPALILLLLSIPRVLLRMTFRPLHHGYVFSSTGFQKAGTMEHKAAFHKLLSAYQSSPVNRNSFAPLEEYVGEVDTLIKAAYQAASLTASQRAALERNTFLTATIPDILLPAVTEALTTRLETLMAKIDPGKIHVHDVSWLGLTDDERTRHFHEGHIIDVVRKMPLASSVRLRTCPRCGSVMEDIHQGQAGHQMWIWQSHKVCVCFSSWAEKGGD
jgi:mediator of RNA polymerase II transcription subunit 16